MNNKTGLIAGGVLLLLLIIGGAVWAMRGGEPKKPPQHARLNEMATQIADENVEPQKKEEISRQFNEELEKMTPDDRQAYFEDNQDEMERQQMERAEKQLADFFSKSQAEQNAELDRMVAEMQRMQNGDRGGRGGRPNDMMMMMGGPGGGWGGGGGGGGGRGGRGGGGGGGGRGAGMAGGGPQSFGTTESGKSAQGERNKKQINSGSPTMRAQQDEMRRMMSDRMNRTR